MISSPKIGSQICWARSANATSMLCRPLSNEGLGTKNESVRVLIDPKSRHLSEEVKCSWRINRLILFSGRRRRIGRSSPSGVEVEQAQAELELGVSSPDEPEPAVIFLEPATSLSSLLTKTIKFELKPALSFSKNLASHASSLRVYCLRAKN